MNLLAAAVLYFLAVGGVQGFAFTLGLTTLVDLAIILWFTHPLMELLVRTELGGGAHQLSGHDPEHLGAKSAASDAGRGRFREPKRNEKHAKRADQPGRKSIAQQRREAEEAAKMEAEAAVVDTAEDASTEEEGK